MAASELTQPCPNCSADVPGQATECPGCGLSLSRDSHGAIEKSSDSYAKVDKIADDATRLVHDIMKVARGASRVGHQVADLTKSGKGHGSDPHESTGDRLRDAGGRAVSKVKRQTQRMKGTISRSTQPATAKVRGKLHSQGRKLKAEGRKLTSEVSRAMQNGERTSKDAGRKLTAAAHRTRVRVRRAVDR